MIDRRKNVCYVISVPYEDDKKDGCFITYKRQKFISLHGIQTKQFKEFRDNYFREVLKVNPSRIGEWDYDGKSEGTQETISRNQWEDEKVRKRVLEGITEREKCK